MGLLVRHVGLWKKESRPPPKIKGPTADYCAIDQMPVYDSVDPDYPFEAYL
jgi:hypothetical protein